MHRDRKVKEWKIDSGNGENEFCGHSLETYCSAVRESQSVDILKSLLSIQSPKKVFVRGRESAAGKLRQKR